MKILIVSQYFWPENFRINTVARKLADAGADVEVLTGKPNYPVGQVFPGYKTWGCTEEVYQGIPVYRIPLVGRGRHVFRLALNYLFFVFSGLLFAPWMLRGRQYDVIFVYAPSPILQTIPAIFLGWLKRAPVILWVQDLWPESMAATGYVSNRLILKWVGWVVRRIYRHTDLLLVQSPAFIKPVSDLAPGKTVLYYPNSVDEEFSVSEAQPPTPNIQWLGDHFNVMFAGNIGTAQAVEVIVEAATLLKNYSEIKFVVVGDGSRREWMQQMVSELGLQNLILPGRFPPEDMPALMQKASVLLVTLSNRDIFKATIPSKIQSYLAAGRPIVASLNGVGSSLVADSGAGLSVPAEDGEALANAVLKLYRMCAQERDEMGRRGREYYEAHFSHEILISQLIGHFNSVLASEKREKL